MKVAFLEDVPNVARAGEIKEVADGYGRNFLIPRKLAVLANSQASSIIEAQLKKKALLQAQTEEEMSKLADQLEGKEVTLKAKAGAKDRLYGSITSADIAAELEKGTGLVIDKRKIELTEPIRQVGSYEVAIRLTKDIMPKIKLTVVEEEKEDKAEKKEKEEKKKEDKAEKKEVKGKKKEDKAEKKEVKGKKKEGRVEKKEKEEKKKEGRTEKKEVKEKKKGGRVKKKEKEEEAR